MKKVIIIFVAAFAIASLCDAKEMTTLVSAETNGAVASRVDAMESVGKTHAQRALTRQEIRNMPILERPNRVGHFYGNTVRRRYNRTH